MNKEQLARLRKALHRLESAAPSQSREIETSIEATVSQIVVLLGTAEEPDTLSEAVMLLKIPKQERRKLSEIASEIQELLDLADYDRGGEKEFEESLQDLKTEFCELLHEQLDRLETGEKD